MDGKRFSFCVAVVVFVLGLQPREVSGQVAQNPPAMGIPPSPTLVGDASALAREAHVWYSKEVRPSS